MKLNRKDYIRVNQILRERNIDTSQFKHVNCCRHHQTESKEHWAAKVKTCYELYKKGHPYLTEVWTSDKKKRYDILDLKDNIDIEIEKSRSKKSYKGDREIKIGGKDVGRTKRKEKSKVRDNKES